MSSSGWSVGSQRSCNGDQKHILNQRKIDRQDEFALRNLSKNCRLENERRFARHL